MDNNVIFLKSPYNPTGSIYIPGTAVKVVNGIRIVEFKEDSLVVEKGQEVLIYFETKNTSEDLVAGLKYISMTTQRKQLKRMSGNKYIS